MLWKSINQDNNVTQSWFISTEGFLQLDSRGKCSLSMSIWYENIPFNLKTDSLISWSCMAYHRFTLLHHILMLYSNIDSKLISPGHISLDIFVFLQKVYHTMYILWIWVAKLLLQRKQTDVFVFNVKLAIWKDLIPEAISRHCVSH